MSEITEERARAPLSDLDLSYLDKSDLGNAQRLKERFGDNLKFVPRLGWRAWVGTHWAVDEDGLAAAARAAHETAFHIADEVQALLEGGKGEAESPEDFDKRVNALRKFKVESGNSGRTKAMLAQAQHYMHWGREMWDKDPLTLNCRNGTLKFEKTDAGVRANLMPHSRADYCTAMTGCDYDASARAPLWDKHLKARLPDPDKRAFFQRFIGYSLTGFTSEQAFVIMQGGGRDGKSTSINAIDHMMGGYAMNANIKSFLSNDYGGGADASPDIARLAGPARFVHLSEPKKAAKLDEAAVKTLTGGDKITARKLREDFFEFYPSFKMVLPCNPLPIITSADYGTWRRILLLEWTERIADAEDDKHFTDKLKTEASGILNWAIEGLGDWMHEELTPPRAVVSAVRRYKGDSDPIGEWMDERCDLGAHLPKILQKDLYEDYVVWADENDYFKPFARSFGNNLTSKQIKSVRQSGMSWRLGIGFKPGIRPRRIGEKADADVDKADPGQPVPPVSAYEDE